MRQLLLTVLLLTITPRAALAASETGARIVVVSPAVCSRADLLHRILGHVAAPAAVVA